MVCRWINCRMMWKCTRIRWGIINNMRQVKVNALNSGVFGYDHVKGGSSPTTNINNWGEALKTLVGFKNFLHGNGGMTRHSIVEHLVESRICAMILKGSHSIGFVEGDSTIKNCIFQIVPTISTKKNTNQSSPTTEPTRPNFSCTSCLSPIQNQSFKS